MSTKLVFPCALMLAVLVTCAIRAEDSPQPTGMDPAISPPQAPSDGVPPSVGPVAPSLSKWLTYTRPDCCGPIGGNGQIKSELFVRTGPSLPVEGRIFGHILETGWVVEGGGRTLFFNPGMDAAWTVDLSVSNIRNQGQHSDFKFPILEPGAAQSKATSLKNLNRTNLNAALGRDWYLWGKAFGCEPRWCIGIDAGGRIGSVRGEFHEVPHRTDVLGGAFVGLHTDLEIPCGCCVFLAGFRAEWGYNWMDILQLQNNSDLEDVNLLLTAGIRF